MQAEFMLINSIVPDNWSIINWSIISKTDRNLRQLSMVDYGYMIDLDDRLPIDDMLDDRFYVSGRKLAQYNNILIDR